MSWFINWKEIILHECGKVSYRFAMCGIDYPHIFEFTTGFYVCKNCGQTKSYGE